MGSPGQRQDGSRYTVSHKCLGQWQWSGLDCFQRVQSQRFTNVFAHLMKSPDSDGANNQLDVVQDKLAHYSCLTLAHLLALISQPTTNLIASDVSLVVINCLSALVNSSLPKAHGSKASSKFTKGQTPSAKRLQGLQSLMNSLQKLAATRNCAVVLLTQCATKMQSEYGATLVPAVNASVWEQGVSTRVVLFRDWTWQANKSTSVFLAGPQKVDGQAVDEAMEHLSAFQIEDIGVSSTPYDHATNRPSIDVATTMSEQPKRKLGQTGLEVPDSEDDEDYGWAEEDEAALPPPPSQWQGSEDIILGQEIGASDDDLEQPYRYWEDEDGEIGEGDRSKSEEAT